MEQSAFKFVGFRVPEISIDVKDSYLMAPSHKNSLSVNIQNNFIKDNNRFVEVVLNIKVDDSSGGLKMNFTIKGGFLANPEMTDEMFAQMYKVNAPAVLLPHARAIISSFTAQMGMPQVVLPLINLTANIESPSVELSLEEKV